jgi:ribosomal protein S18 acetylase RimI-like enzyme
MNSNSISVRLMSPRDIPFADSLRSMAGWNQTVHDWAGFLAFAPNGCFIAEVDGVPAGTATTILYEGKVGWIGMVLVHPEKRRLGVGNALLRHTIASLRSQGAIAIKLDATPAGKNVYLPLGFCEEYNLTRFEGNVPTAAPPSSAEHDVQSFTAAHIQQVADFDLRVFGVARPSVFSSLITRSPNLCFVTYDRSSVCGYLIAREGATALQLGPWAARSPDIAISLFRTFMDQTPGRRLFLDIPGPNLDAARYLGSVGFKSQRDFTRMYLGANPLPGTPTLVYGTSGAEKG